MSQNVPPPVQGQLEAPNPLEMFWEQNKRVLIFGAVAAVVALAINYFVQYQWRRATAEKWSALSQASGLAAAYADPEITERWAAVQAQMEQWDAMAAQNPGMAQQLQFQRQYSMSSFFGDLEARQVRDLDKPVRSADPGKLEAIVEAGDSRSPIALWVLANQAYFKDDFDGAKATLEKLRSGYPKHFLCISSEYPVQWRPAVPKDDSKPEVEPTDPRKAEKPELVPPKAGSAVDLMLARIDTELSFQAENPRFYVPKQPTSAETVTIEIENAGTIKIKLFTDLVPHHAEKFLELAKSGWWAGMRIHELRREPQPNPTNRSVPDEMVFGWLSTKDQDDRSLWVAGDVAEDHVLDWEQAEISHFPGTVAVELAKAGRSQVERIVINGDDAAAQADGTRVAIGRVIEGLDVVENIVNGGFADATSVGAGRGKPQDDYVIKSVTIE